MPNRADVEAKNEIVVYQPNETMRLDVRLENDALVVVKKSVGKVW